MRKTSEPLRSWRWLLAPGLVLVFVLAGVVFILGLPGVARRKQPESEERRYISCRSRLYAVAELLRKHIEDYGGMPYVPSLPEIVDPMREGWPLRDWILISCPLNAELSEGRLVDSGFRTFNWPSEVWSIVQAEVCRAKKAAPANKRRETPEGGEAPPGVMLVWTAKPVRNGKRYVQVLPDYGGGFVPDNPLSSGLTTICLLDEREFEEKMQEVKRASDAIRKMGKHGIPTLPPQEVPVAPGAVGDQERRNRRFHVYTGWPFDAQEAKRRQEATAQGLGVKVAHDFDLGQGTQIALVLIPAGEFMMGSPPWEEGRYADEELHRVVIGEPFRIGKYEVTQEQWEAVMGENPSKGKGPRNPVDNVSWDDVHGFLRKLNNRAKDGRFSLPTEAQWEYACRAGRQERFYFGDRETDLARYGWFGKGLLRAQEVGALIPNAWGLYDMHGNAYEWCASPYSESYDGRESRGAEAKGPERVFRGGSWGIDARSCRSAARLKIERSHKSVIGFRVCFLPDYETRK